jgi:hypothetical protein
MIFHLYVSYPIKKENNHWATSLHIFRKILGSVSRVFLFVVYNLMYNGTLQLSSFHVRWKENWEPLALTRRSISIVDLFLMCQSRRWSVRFFSLSPSLLYSLLGHCSKHFFIDIRTNWRVSRKHVVVDRSDVKIRSWLW